MRSACIIMTERGKVELVREEVPDPDEHELIVETKYSLISAGTEITCLLGDFEEGTSRSRYVRYPFAPGYNVAGVVAKVGKKVRVLKEGDRVCIPYPHRKYHLLDDKFPFFMRIPPEVSYSEACTTPLSTILQHVIRRASPALGERFLVVGCGLVGLLAIAYLKLLTPRTLVAVDPIAERARVAWEMGATEVVIGRAGEKKAYLMSLTGGRGYDSVYECSGVPKVLSEVMGLARIMGKVVVMSEVGRPSQQCLTSELETEDLTILSGSPTNMPLTPTPHAPWTMKEMGELYMEFLARKVLDARSLISRVYSPEDADRAYQSLIEEKDSLVGVAFDWDRLAI